MESKLSPELNFRPVKISHKLIQLGVLTSASENACELGLSHPTSVPKPQWTTIPINTLVDCLPGRVEAVIAAEGEPTPY